MSAPASVPKDLKPISAQEVARHDGGITIKNLSKQLENTKDADEKAKLEETIKQYSKETWIIIHGLVIDVTKFKTKHPGGPQSFVETAGKDATKEFEELYHSASAREMLRDLIVGKLDTYEDDLERAFQSSSADDASQNLGILIAIGVAAFAAAYFIFA